MTGMPAGFPELPEDAPASTFLAEETADERREFRRHAIKWTLAFLLLFAGVFFAFWWSGSAVRFGASRVTQETAMTYKVSGTVLDAQTRQPVPWAEIRDDSSGRPPFGHATADRSGVYELLTVAEPHRILVTANGYRSKELQVGRQWFVWMPRGTEQRDIQLLPQ